jgi:hypothetical protein
MNPKKKDRRNTTSQRKSVFTAYNTTMRKPVIVSKRKKKKGREKQKKRQVLVLPGIYHHLREGTYHEGPEIEGKRTWRSLGVNFTPQRNLQAAKDEYYRRRNMEYSGPRFPTLW